MIGNLVLALGIACVCGAPLVNEIQPRNAAAQTGTIINDNIHSDVLNNDVYCFSRGNVSFSYSDFSDTRYAMRYILGSDGYSQVNEINYSNPPLNDMLYTMADSIQFAEWQSDTINSNYAYFFTQFVVVNNNEYAWITRAFVPLNSGIGAIEIHPANNLKTALFIGNWDTGVVFANNRYLLDGNVDFVIMDNTNLTINGGYYVNDYPSRFMQYGWIFITDGGNFSYDAYLYGNLNGDYNLGYQTGYQAGYYEGEASGYTTGYAEGLRVGHSANASFLSLMSSIADTPIRFLKQMFSFELFGMNVAVVILSCLTAVVIFGIVKKVWK